MILVFVGAGGSAAVDPEKYPTTRGFFKKLEKEKEIKRHNLFVAVENFLQRNGEEPLDIEKILWTLDELKKIGQALMSPSILSWLMENNNAGFIKGVNPKELKGSLQSLKREQIGPLQENINAKVHEFYAKKPEKEELSTWILFLRELSKIDPVIEIFTTNYDLVLENAIVEAGLEIETGRDYDGIQAKLSTQFWQGSPSSRHPNYTGLLTKLHGSVDWQLGNNGDINISDTFTGQTNKHCALYPGFKGEPTREPFSLFHRYLRSIVQSSPIVAIFIGFSFRDPHISDILNNDLPKETPSYFITKGSETDLPPGAPSVTTYTHIAQGLIPEVVEGILKGVAADARLQS